ncbi:RagB/SusD family nutrient uptake outer membrane protein [Hymenobacter arcticus]
MKRTLYFALLSGLACSCTSKLEQLNPNQLTADTYWKTEADIQGGIAGTYKTFKAPFNGYYGYKGVQLVNGRGDDFFIRNDSRDMYQSTTFTNTATTGQADALWSGCYRGILRANEVIEKVPGIAISDALKKQYLAEAKFLRALNYYYLIINFREVPLILTVPTDRAQYSNPKAKATEVWAQIEADFTEAKAGLPVVWPSQFTGRATQGAAIGFLAKSYVYEEKWAAAEGEFKLIAQPSGQAKAPYGYDLLANYEDNFLKDKDNNMESLFEIQMQNVGGSDLGGSENGTSNETQGSTTAQAMAPSEAGGWYQGYPTQKVFNEFQKEKTPDGKLDPRMYATLIWEYPGATFYQKPYSLTTFPNPFGKVSRVRKYQNYTQVNEYNTTGVSAMISDINEKALRYADVLLLYAETLTKLGRPAEATPLVNRIRTRATLAALPAGYTAAQMLAEIQHQRMIELFREGQRFYDLRRWGILEQEIKNSDKEGKDFFVLAKHAYFPIPQSEINTNANIVQDPNW